MITLRTPAKINVGLWVERLRSDGYHDLRSVFMPVNLFDTLNIDTSPSGIILTCDAPYVPSDSENLVYKTAYLYFTYTGVRSGVKIELTKRIPVGHGLGGGSSDAAAALQGLDRLFETGLSPDEMRSLLLEVGMDCPFFLSPRPSLATGRGAELEALQIPSFDVLIYSPGFGVSTSWAYRHLGRLTNGEKPCKLLIGALAERRYQDVEQWLYNSFEEVVYERYPELQRISRRLKEQGAWFGGISGSGSAVYAALPPEVELALEEDSQGRLIRVRTLESWDVV